MRRRGFTLIELIVAMVLAVVLLGLASQVYITGMNARARLRETASDMGALRRAYEAISRDLHSATVAPDDSGMQFGLSATGAGAANNVLQMASNVGEPLLAGRAASETTLIQYAVTEDPRTGRPGLWRYETPYPVPDPTSGGTTEPERATFLLPGVRQAGYLFYSAEQQNWIESWEGEVGLPSAIRMDLEIETRPGAETTYHQSWVFSLPAAAYETEEAAAAAEAETDTGTTEGLGTTGGVSP